jgi:hypothetical protein
MKKTIIYLFLFFIFFFFSSSVSASSLPFQLRGHFLIDVEDNGQAWYVDLENGLRHKVDKEFIKKVGLGISSSNLERIPMAINNNIVEKDSDGDGLDDRLEKALGTDPYNSDSDGDSYSDDVEILNHYRPLGKGKLPIDIKFASDLSGKFLIDVDKNGELWYVSPIDNLRYYIPDYDFLVKIIAVLGKGINSQNIGLVADANVFGDNPVKSIKVDTSKKQRMYYFLDDVQIGSFPISAGTSHTPTPKGEYSIINKHPMAWSPYGLWMPYWLGLGTGRFGFHELPIWPSGYREGEDHLGTAASHGCIRLGIGPAKFLYNWSEIGTPVYIY